VQRVTLGEQQQRAAELGERVARHTLQQGHHRRAFDRVAPVSGVRPRGEKQPLGVAHPPPIQGDPPLERQRLDARVARELRVGAVQLPGHDLGACQLEA